MSFHRVVRIGGAVIHTVEAGAAHNQHTVLHNGERTIDLRGIVVVSVHGTPVDSEGVVAHTAANLQTRDIVGNGFAVNEAAACHLDTGVGSLVRIEHGGIAGGESDRTFGDHHVAVGGGDMVLAGHILRAAHHGAGQHLIVINTCIHTAGVGLAYGGGQHIAVGKGVAVARSDCIRS